MDLNNHEIAILIWFSVISLWALLQKSVRKAFREVIKSFFVPSILLTILIATIYIALWIWVLSQVGLWKIDNLKTTILWGTSFALLAIFNINSVNNDKGYFKSKVVELLTFSGSLSFISELFDLSISTEIVLIPLTTFLSIIYYS
jgi:hypothetical protein